MNQNLLAKLYVDELKDLYSAENQLVKALPKMAKASTSPELRAGFEEHLEQTKGHVQRLEEIFDALQESPKGKTCKGMQGLIEEGGEMIGEGLEPEELDAGLISAAQRVEHYEMAAYGSVRTHAKLLGENEAERLLDQTYQEEKATDQKLTKLSESVNVEAMQAGAEGDEGEEQPAPSAKKARKKAAGSGS